MYIVKQEAKLLDIVVLLKLYEICALHSYTIAHVITKVILMWGKVTQQYSKMGRMYPTWKQAFMESNQM